MFCVDVGLHNASTQIPETEDVNEVILNISNKTSLFAILLVVQTDVPNIFMSSALKKTNLAANEIYRHHFHLPSCWLVDCRPCPH